MVGLFPGSVAENLGGDSARMMLHGIGALLAIVGGNVLVLVTALSARKKFPNYALVSFLLGIVGAMAALLFAMQIDLGLGIGTMERIAVNPVALWIILTGVSTFVGPARKPPVHD